MKDRRFTFFKGRVALHAILRAAGIGDGDEVLLPGYTCIVVPNAILYCGAKPVYLDIDAATYNLDITQLDAGAGTRWDPARAKAIIVQHTYGIPCDMDAIAAFAARHDLLVIEDSCHALGSTWKGREVGTIGDAAFFSSQWSKPVTTGLGGWAVVGNDDLAARMETILPDYVAPAAAESLRLQLQYLVYGIVYRPRLFWMIQGLYRKLGEMGLVIGSSTGEELSCREPGDYMKAMGPTQRRLLEKHLAGLDRIVGERRRNTEGIVTRLEAAGLPTVNVPDDCDAVFLRYPVPVADKDAVLAEARRRRIQLGDWFLSPVHPNLERWELAGYQAGECPVAEDVSRHTINIPTGARLSSREIDRTVAFLAEQSGR